MNQVPARHVPVPPRHGPTPALVVWAMEDTAFGAFLDGMLNRLWPVLLVVCAATVTGLVLAAAFGAFDPPTPTSPAGPGVGS